MRVGELVKELRIHCKGRYVGESSLGGGTNFRGLWDIKVAKPGEYILPQGPKLEPSFHSRMHTLRWT